MISKNIIYTLIGLLFASALIALLWWLKPGNAKPLTYAPANPTATIAGNAQLAPSYNSNPVQSNNNVNSTTLNTALAPSLKDTQVDCDLQADPTGNLILNSNIHHCFEYFLTQLGEKTMPVIEAQVHEYFTQHLPNPAAGQALDLWQRYLKYRDAQAHLDVKSGNDTPQHMQEVFNALNTLRQQFFKPAEITALFGEEMTYNQYTLDRMAILDNKQLDANQKAQALKDRFNQLPEDLQKNLKDISKLQDLRALTAQIKDKNGSPEELRQMRLNLVGADATQRLEQLDQNRANWQQRIDGYLSARQAILSSNQSDNAKQQAIDTLRAQQFNTEAERQRAITFEHLKAQGIDSQQVLK